MSPIEASVNHDKLKELFFSEQLEERKLGFAMMQQLGFLAAREFLDKVDLAANYGLKHAVLLIAFEVPRCMSYGGLLADFRFRRIRRKKDCPARTKAILTCGSFDENFLKIIFSNMERFGQDVTVANEKGWLLKSDSTEEDWNYKVGKDEGWYLTGMKNISWDHMKY